MRGFLGFLIRLPNKYLIFCLFLIVFPSYLYFQTEFLGQITDKLLIAILALLGSQKPIAEYFNRMSDTSYKKEGKKEKESNE